MKKYALGIHHLNVAYCSGDISSYHRQVRESIVPLFNLLFDHPTWCFTVELCGYSIEFLYTNYREVFNQLKELIDNRQIELISVTYSPQIWIAFPGHDLIRSIEINQRLLKKYNIKPSRIFFTQENFFGIGAATLKQWFDAAVVKEDYYYHFNPYPSQLSDIRPFYQLSDMKLLVGWGHILETVASRLQEKTILEEQAADDYDQLSENFNLFDKAAERFASNPLSGHVCTASGVEWTWYHIGSSERFSKPLIHPNEFSTCKFNPDWYYRLESVLLTYEQQGFSFTGITSYLDQITTENQPSMRTDHPLLDGAWNMQMSEGCLIWMGLNIKPHEDALGVRNHNWLSRTRLLAIETLASKIVLKKKSRDIFFSRLEDAWKHQFLAESSDATGWYPEECEVLDSIYHSDIVLNLVAQLTAQLKTAYQRGTLVVNTQTGVIENRWYRGKKTKIEREDQLLCPLPQFYGADHEINYYQISESQQEISIDFIPNENECGLKIPFIATFLQYSPALLENELVDFDLDRLQPSIVYLALTNGIIGIGKDYYLIKHNELMSIACCINKSEREISYKIRNPIVKLTRWKITIFKGAAEEALALALSINIYPIVHL